jgi:uncharacterized small protein (DUF1192 family)
LSTTPEEAPFGYKADGTPRKRPAPEWLSDPERVAAAAAKRTRTRKTATAVASNGHAPALSVQEVGDLLARIDGEFGERLAVIEAEQLRLETERQRLQAGRDAIKQGQALAV